MATSFNKTLEALRSDMRFKILAELERERILIEASPRDIVLDEMIRDSIRAEQPKAKDSAAFETDIKAHGITYPLQVIPSFDSGFNIILWEGNQRRKALENVAPDSKIEIVVWATMTKKEAIERGAAANFQRFEAADDDIMSLIQKAGIREKSRLMALSGKSEKTVQRYLKLVDSGLAGFIGICFNATYALNLLDACTSDGTVHQAKIAKVIDAVIAMKEKADSAIAQEKLRASEAGEDPDSKKLEMKTYFSDALLKNWTTALKTGDELALEPKDRKKAVQLGTDADWKKKVPELDIEKREWDDFSMKGLADLKKVGEKLILHATRQEFLRKGAEAAVAIAQADQANAPCGTVGPEPLKPAKHQTVASVKEGVGAAENPGPTVDD